MQDLIMLFEAQSHRVMALWAFEFRIAAVVVLLIDYIFDFITRRCPFCGKHFSIVLTVKDRCPFCGKLFE